MTIVRDYGAGGVSVVIATNEQGRVEPFVFERREDAERVIGMLKEDCGDISHVLGWHGVETLSEHATQRLTFGLQGLRVRKGS